MSLERIELRHGDVLAEVVPARGALVTRLSVAGTEVLYLDRATLDDPTKNVRGGIPLLFPYAGKLPNKKQHGFARDRAWTVTERDAASLRMTIANDADWPYAFTAHHAVMLLPRGLEVALTIVAADQALPVSPGWHPYFATTDKTKVTGTLATPTADEFDTGAPAPIDGRSRFTLPGTGELSIEASPEMRHLQLWSQPGKPFICIEPFYGPAGTVETAPYIVPANAARTFWMRLRLG
jgi:galactose mutarotase-like enzyme